MQDLCGKTAFVTGGASGIGLGIARAFLAAGMNVVIADIRDDHLEAAREELKDSSLLPLLLDVTDRPMFEEVAAVAVRRFGKIHVLCNNAGVGVIGTTTTTGYDDWDWCLDVHLNGVFNGLHTFLPLIRSHGEGGHIVNTASTAALLPGGLAYAAAKAGVLAMSEVMRSDLAAENIGVSCLLPGPTATNLHQVAVQRPERFRKQTKLAEAEAMLQARQRLPDWLDPRQVGEMVLDAVVRDLPFIITHSEFREGAEERFAAILHAFPDRAPVQDAERKLGFPLRNPMYRASLDLVPGYARSSANAKEL